MVYLVMNHVDGYCVAVYSTRALAMEYISRAEWPDSLYIDEWTVDGGEEE